MLLKVSCEESVYDLGLDKFIYPNSKLIPSSGDKEGEVEMGFGKIGSADQQLFTTEVGSCTVVLMQADGQEGKISHIGLAHLFSENDIPVFEKTLQSLIDKTNDKAIKIIICGGMSDSISVHNELVEKLKSYNVQIVADHFAKSQEIAVIGSNKTIFRGVCGIRRTGFDKNSIPYAIYYAELDNINPEEYKNLKLLYPKK